ncbi:hypothetical protein [Dactylosporangium sp. NPDC051541]|uniref:hypothetical protein n=1 Tax=Dactylosporangium sp. NPDC051541 TaxID=3363977 RepID=UPI003792582D
MSGVGTVFDRSPLYVVLFSAADADAAISPIVSAQEDADTLGTVPHGLDRNVAGALPGLWYCLNLPNTFRELIDIPALAIKAAQVLHLDHHILLAPIELFDSQLLNVRSSYWPTLVVCPDELLHEATGRSTALGFALPPAGYSQLSSESLRAHWRAIHAHFAPDAAYLGDEPTLTNRLDLAPVDLPRRWLARQFGPLADSPSVAVGDLDSLFAETIHRQVNLAAIARLEREDTAPDAAAALMPQVYKEEQAQLRVPVTLALPGVAPAYIRSAYDSLLKQRVEPLTSVDPADTWSVTMHHRTDALVERAAIEFVATHHALARGGIGVMFPTVPPAAFTILAQLERHFEAPRPDGPAVWRLLDRLDAATRSIWTGALVWLVRHASTLTVFANFPIGLLRLPGDTSPLSTRVPITYRPLLPLTRSVQLELAFVPAIDLSVRLRVLVAECIPADDRIGPESRQAWEFAAEAVQGAGGKVTMDIVETLSVDALRRAIEAARPDVLKIFRVLGESLSVDRVGG